MTLSFPVGNIGLDRNSETPLHRQLYRQLRELIEHWVAQRDQQNRATTQPS